MTQKTFTGPGRAAGHDIPRDRWKRPLIVPAGGGNPIPYTRVSTLAGILDDTSNLALWKTRMAIRGLLTRDDLRYSAAADIHDDKALNKVIDAAQEAAASSAKSTTGTALHTFTEKLDRGLDLGPVPAELRGDLAAYQQATKKMRMAAVESFVVCDEVQAAGTFDRLIEFEGVLYIGDLKTGRVDYPHKFAIQKAIYSRGKDYNPATFERASIGDVDQDWALLLHLPAGESKCEIHWIDIAAGWEAAEHAWWVHQWRKRKDLASVVPADRLARGTSMLAPQPEPEPTPVLTEGQLADWISKATKPEHLTQLWRDHATAFTPGLNELAAAQHHLITGGLIAAPA